MRMKHSLFMWSNKDAGPRGESVMASSVKVGLEGPEKLGRERIEIEFPTGSGLQGEGLAEIGDPPNVEVVKEFGQIHVGLRVRR